MTYWIGDEAVKPLLARGLEPQPSRVAPQKRELRGPLTPEFRALLRGPGKGKFPWWSVELLRGEEPLYFIEEHEDTALWNAAPEEMQALYDAGVDPSVVEDLAAQQHLREAQRISQQGFELLATAICQTLFPGGRGYSYGSFRHPDTPGQILVYIGDAPNEVWLEYDAAAAVLITSLDEATGVVAQLEPPLRPGDSLRLEAGAGAPLLRHKSTALGPRWQRFTHALPQPTRAEWLRVVSLLARRADLCAFCWLEEPPAANGWRSDYGRERLLPFVTAEGWIDFPPSARQMVGALTPEALAVLLDEPPHGLPDLERGGPARWTAKQPAPSPWWWLLLISGQEILLQSRNNGARVDLALTGDEADLLESSQISLVPVKRP